MRHQKNAFSHYALTRLYSTIGQPLLLMLGLLILVTGCQTPESPKSVDNKAHEAHLKQWQADKFGMFIHWGLYSIPAGVWKGEKIPFYSEQIMTHARIPVEEYKQLANQFNPQAWNAEEVVLLAKQAGMRYIVLTTKHHDGFCMFKTATSDFNIVDATPFGRDVLLELSEACAKHGVKLGLYYSLPDWSFDKGVIRGVPDTTTTCREHVNQLYGSIEVITPELEEVIVQQVSELLTNYGPIETIWFDMGLPTPEQSKRFKQTVRGLQPECLINGRIMNNEGDYLTLTDNSKIVGLKACAWDNPASMYGTWGYRSWEERGAPSEMAEKQLHRLMNTISNGGVFLLNIGPKADGSVLSYEKEVLGEMGDWVEQHKEAIYNTAPSPFEQLRNAYCTHRGDKLYFTVSGNEPTIECHNLITPITKAYLLHQPAQTLEVKTIEQGVAIVLPKEQLAPLYTIVAELSDSVPEVKPVYISPENGCFRLTEANSLTYPLFDGKTYISMQPEAKKRWNLEVKEAGRYNLTVEYIPSYTNRRYHFSFPDATITEYLPGIDRWLQTSVPGTVNLSEGTSFLELTREHSEDLEPLGVKIKEIRLERIIR